MRHASLDEEWWHAFEKHDAQASNNTPSDFASQAISCVLANCGRSYLRCVGRASFSLEKEVKAQLRWQNNARDTRSQRRAQGFRMKVKQVTKGNNQRLVAQSAPLNKGVGQTAFYYATSAVKKLTDEARRKGQKNSVHVSVRIKAFVKKFHTLPLEEQARWEDTRKMKMAEKALAAASLRLISDARSRNPETTKTPLMIGDDQWPVAKDVFERYHASRRVKEYILWISF